jgi:NAD(P)-dependent dehydrogenase (short-subunit alcohol dehydrogenase family)
MSTRSVTKRQAQYPRPPFPPQEISPPGIEEEMNPKPQYEAPLYKAAGKLTGRKTLITGGDSGIGRSVATLFAREGADVALVYLPEEQVDADVTAERIAEAGGEALLLPGDLREAAFCEDCIRQVMERFGRLDVLVNNAAFQKHRPSLNDIDDEQWDRTFRTNVYGSFYLTRAALPHLERGSSIIFSGSITGLEGNAQLLDYSATKGAIHAFAKSLAQNLIERGVRVNCVSPGPVWTPLNPAERKDDEVAEFGGDTPLGRPAQPEEVSPAFVFFASAADSGYITGEVLTLLGGDTTAA